ncbi:MAG TPA: isocitrate/isopropylmalate dehydrogenase family protein [Atribacter sp.]|mgnify:CR=1 FL=1|jgi:isocitrate dehydrogenase (NAD+)|uniref:Isocitrate dehydrogenase (NADP) n=1 Tax=Candidatus Atribacter allofermentans TaxID=1852833 RepID=A0A1V5SK26_9BACT|nr:isocitrate/isopropylmalate dehydrogenase family protein [Atribacter sp.]MDD3713402.1 isocitrate/isopropylmalate dehydrogenase family protein [Atribacterota bacterium]OQA54312.1 MAG: Isocitrate dehydrogenase (NADP) [Candidatus Atribacteria bacterium ADurb.Bin276]HQK83029.1 isocitrate/isopropylmalate dehydrogenase family protein [Atribacter sp.]
MKHTITLIPGDGTGPEITETVVRVLEATGLKIEWDVQEAGSDVLEKYGTPLPNQVLESIKRNKVALKGPITTPVGTGFRSVNVALRKELDLFACLRPCKTYPGVRSRYENIDLVIIRENTEDLYAGIEFEVNQEATTRLIQNIKELSGHSIRTDTGLSIKPISIFGSKRIVTFAFEYARQNNRHKVTAVHKANIMKYSDGLFLQVARQVASNYPDIEFEDRIVDNMCMQLVQKPELYDVLVLPNLYGDILSDLGAGLVGGLGVAPGANIGTDYAVFEPTHGSAPKYKNQNKVNPMAMILSGMMMLQYIGEKEKAQKLEKAVAKVIQENRFVTYDMKPISNQDQAAKTNEVGEAIIRALTK